MTQPGRVRAFFAARLSPEGVLGLRFTLGVGAILLAAYAFGALAEDVVTGASITLVDVRLAHWFHAHATPGFTREMLFVTHADGLVGTSIMATLLALWFRRRALNDWVLATFIAVPGGMLLNVALKHAFRRARPHFDDPLLSIATYSFPSGHTAAATVFWGLLACFLATRLRTRWVRVLVLAGAAAMVALVALSRMYLGVHYLSDVLAAAAEGCAWRATCFTALGAWRRRRAAAAGAREGAP
jgi:undecaprenyl-diphosphatase